ncbi:phosphate acyltransferase PlsX [Candidatus Desantisbacteria bacterium]|nr:phosphate acyltransferase PlsX [Candidatus Desantisbacteria bacterium]
MSKTEKDNITKFKIAVDAMGGDNAPLPEIQGAVEAARQLGIPIILVGNEEKIGRELKKYKISGLQIEVVHAEEAVGMDELPSRAIRKKNSSIAIAVKLVKEKEAVAVVSAGSTGAVMACSLLGMGRLHNISRPAIAAPMPTITGEQSILMDAGANMDCKPKNLLEFAIMGDVYARYVIGKKNPRIGLLSVGEEEYKGNDLAKQSYDLIKNAPLNFIGNVEGREIVNGGADVIICDGFTGNSILKFGEGLAEMIMTLLKKELASGILSKFGTLLLSPAFNKFKKRVDYSEYGGAPLLGLKGLCIICHGSSSAKAIRNGIRVAHKFAVQRVNEHIHENFKLYEEKMGCLKE